ncbi:hypothetical protein AC1031_017358 [Aphanomyces cochlioides]|nr:hypothetical protein AC1031_017358 [Aphanomyces cochlioides]
MGTDQEASEPSMSRAVENNDHVEITMHIPPGARTSESEGPSEDVVLVKEKKTMVEPQDDSVVEEKDYVDPTLFSAEVSRHSMDIAVRRARNLEQELRDMEKEAVPPPPVSYTKVLTTAVTSTVMNAMKRISMSTTTRYSLLDTNTSPSEGSMDERDVAEGDGMQLSPIGNGDDDLYLERRSKIRPALRKISAYDMTKRDGSRKKKSIAWIALPGEVEDDTNVDNESLESSSRVNDQVKITINQDTSSRPKRQKAGVIRRLSPMEKEELYAVRPDLRIVPNWAQKYREEMSGVPETVQCNNWLAFLILFLMALLVFLFYMIGVTKPGEVS